MTTQEQNRRSEDKRVQVLANQIQNLADDIGEMKDGITQLAAAVTKLAVVEERQTHMILAQERAFKALERVEQRQVEHERNCRLQEKELREEIAKEAKVLALRIDVLEKAEPMQAQTSKWVMAAVWAAAGLLGLFAAKQLGLM